MMNIVFDHSNSGIASSNPARGLDVSAFFYFVLTCVSRGLVRDLPKCLIGFIVSDVNSES